MEESLLVIIGIFGSVIVALLGILSRRSLSKPLPNPNFGTMDEKLNGIITCLARIETLLRSQGGNR